MSFGFSVSDVIAISRLAWKLYVNCKDDLDRFRVISLEVLSLHAVLREFGHNLEGQTLQPSQQVGLERVIEGCQAVLKDLQRLVNKYESLGTRRKRMWNRVRWGSKDIERLRSRLISNTVLLTAFASTSQINVQIKLDEILHEYKQGKRGSTLANRSKDPTTTNVNAILYTIQKQLEEVGVAVAAIEVNKDFIMGWLKTAIATGSIEDQDPEIIPGSDTLKEPPFREAPFQKSSSGEYSRQAPINPRVAVPHIRNPFRNTGISNPAASNTRSTTHLSSAPRWC